MKRKTFLSSMAVAGLGVSLTGSRVFAESRSRQEVSVGMIGLDTSHSPAFARLINNPEPDGPDASGFRLTAAYPWGSRTIESSYSRIPGFTDQVKEQGVEVVDSIEEVLDQADVILLVTNDGNPRLEQALQVLEAGKPMFMDKPVAASLKDTLTIYKSAAGRQVPVFSTSSLRYIKNAWEVRHENKIGEVTGADSFSPATLEESHPDLYWYGIHGVEMLFALLGKGCESVSRIKKEGTDVVTGEWSQGRLGTFRGIREGQRGYGATAYGAEDILPLGPYEGYGGLMENVFDFFRTGNVPVDPEETLEIYAFMDAADESVRRGGEAVTLEEMVERASG